jgi:hypothetical protein
MLRRLVTEAWHRVATEKEEHEKMKSLADEK